MLKESVSCVGSVGSVDVRSVGVGIGSVDVHSVDGYSVGVHSVDVSVDGLGSVGSVILAGRILSQWSSSRRV